MSRLEMQFDKPHLINSVFGEFDRNLVTIENRLGVYISARGNRIQIEGEAGATARARDVLQDIYTRVQRHEDIDPETGSPHLAAIAWHALTLLHWSLNKGLKKKYGPAPAARRISSAAAGRSGAPRAPSCSIRAFQIMAPM